MAKTALTGLSRVQLFPVIENTTQPAKLFVYIGYVNKRFFFVFFNYIFQHLPCLLFHSNPSRNKYTTI